MTAKHDAIKTMKLYHHLDRIERRLRAASPTNSANSANSANSTNNQLDPELLGTLDGLHFFGDEPIRRVQQLIRDQQDHQLANNLPTPPRVLDVGTGFGGSARLLAHRTQCVVDALELQPDLSDVAAQLTARCGLTHRVHHVTGDFLHVQLPETNYNVVVGLLCFLHIGHWRELFTKCLRSLAPGGVLYVEDFFRRDANQPFTDHDASILANDVFCQELLTRDELVHVLEDVGFDNIQLVDVTDKWTPFVQARADAFDADIAKHVQLDGADAAHALQHFYRSVATVFSHGRLGGYTLCARRPPTDSP